MEIGKWILRIIVCIIVITFAAVVYLNLTQNGASHRAVRGLPEPVQTPASGGTSLTLSDYKINIDYLYSYKVDALVVHKHQYKGKSFGDLLSPADLALAWGDVAAKNDSIDFHWSQSDRWYYWRADSYSQLSAVGTMQDVIRQSSNNHIIPADASVKNRLSEIRSGDRVKITGYLVNVTGVRSNGSNYYWKSSVTREDSGARSCEIIYATKIQVIK